MTASSVPRLESAELVELDVDVAADHGPAELWRHGVGIGGINTLPLPAPVVDGTRLLRPRLIRIFIQQFFDVYPGHYRYDWARLDAYLDSIAATGAYIVAAICLKPAALFPVVDHAQWWPNDPAEWQELIRALVHRYSVERELVTHWEVGNETDIGEDGGSPYLIPDPQDYAAFYVLTAAAIHEAAPHVQIGGTAACWVTNEPLPGFVAYCAATQTPLDFISWHLYDDDWDRHALGVREGRRILEQLPEPRPEMMVTEWSKSFEPTSVPDHSAQPRRAAILAATVLALRRERLDWSFYYHLWDQYVDPIDFQPFFSPAGVDNMYRHWNEVPHRFGLFAEDGTPRPQYFVYQLLGRLGETLISNPAQRPHPQVHQLSTRDRDTVSSLLVNVSLLPEPSPVVVTLRFHGLRPGLKLMTVHRIDEAQRWDPQTRRQQPLETRRLVVREDFECQLYLPADTVSLVSLTPAQETHMRTTR